MISFWLRRKKCAIYRFDVTHAAQLMMSKINFCQRDIHRYPQRDIQRGTLNFIPCQEVEKWPWLIVFLTLSQDIMRNCKLCIRKRVQFQIWGTKMVLKKFYQIYWGKILASLVISFPTSSKQLWKCLRGHLILIQCYSIQFNSTAFLNQRPHFCNVL